MRLGSRRLSIASKVFITLECGLRAPGAWFPTSILERVASRLQKPHRFDALAIYEAHVPPSHPRQVSCDIVSVQGRDLIIRKPQLFEDGPCMRPKFRRWR